MIRVNIMTGKPVMSGERDLRMTEPGTLKKK